jgi:hypothetical protein
MYGDGGQWGDAAQAFYAFRRQTKYHYYRDPKCMILLAAKVMVDFGKIATQVGDDAARTETTYWFGPCENATRYYRAIVNGDLVNYCPYGSDDEFDNAPTFRVLGRQSLRSR